MATKLLSLIVVISAMSTVACSKSKERRNLQIQTAMNQCMYDPTGACQQRAKTIMENPQLAGEITRVGQIAIGNSGTGAVQVRNGVVQPILPASIQQQALKVQAALAADSNNPRSLYYDPPQAARQPASATSASVNGSVSASGAPTSAAAAGADAAGAVDPVASGSGTALGQVTR